jgi:hypothetical protein
MLYPAPQNHLLAALAAYLPNVRGTLVPDLKRVLLKQDHVLFDAGVSPKPVLCVVSAKRREKEKMCPILGGRSPLT